MPRYMGEISGGWVVSVEEFGKDLSFVIIIVLECLILLDRLPNCTNRLTSYPSYPVAQHQGQ